MTSSSLVSSWTHCFCPPAHPAFLRLPPVLLLALPSHPHLPLVVLRKSGEVQPQAGCLQSSASVSVVSTTARRFSSVLCESSYAARENNSFVSFDEMLVWSLLPTYTADFHLSTSFGAGFPDPFPTSGKRTSTQNPATFHDTDHPWLDRKGTVHRFT